MALKRKREITSKFPPERELTIGTDTQAERSLSDTIQAGSSRLASTLYLTRGAPATIAILAAALNINLWIKLLEGLLPRAWDGTGHFALAQIYNQSIFPGAFGWTGAYFAGMPFPNFYPPLFYWCVAFLYHTHLFSFMTAFNLALALPTLLLPVVIWVLAKVVSDNDRGIALYAALTSILLLTDTRFEPFGLSYPSTFLIGLYTQPLGFILLVLWYIVYANSDRSFWRIALASVLLALTVLANFFNAVTCAFFIAATVLSDIGQAFRRIKGQSFEARSNARAHIVSPLIAFCLSLFWLAPVSLHTTTWSLALSSCRSGILLLRPVSFGIRFQSLAS